jgi:hypothetical protein
MRKSLHCLLIAATMLGGCSTVQRYHVPPSGVIDDVSAPARILYGASKDGVPPPHDASTIATAFLAAYDRSYATLGPGGQAVAARDARALEMTKLGMTVIEVRCDTFFESIGRGSQRVGFARRELEILSTALTTALGLGGASDTAVAIAGIGSGAALSTVANYETTFFFSPDVGKVQHLVDDALESMRTALLLPDRAPRDFESAIRALKRYQTVCTAHEIKRLVNEAVEHGQIETRIVDRGEVPLAQATDVIRGRIGALFRTAPDPAPAVTIRDVVLMKWLMEQPAPDADALDFICPNITTTDLRERVCEGPLGGRKTTAQFKTLQEALSKAVAAIDLLQPELVADTTKVWQDAEKAGRERLAEARRTEKAAVGEAAKLRAAAEARDVATDVGARADVQSPPPNTTGQSQPSVGVKKPE